MKRCEVCGSLNLHEDYLEEVFRVDGQLVLIEHVPAKVCDRCGEATIARETVERVRNIVHEGKPASRHVSVDVYALT